MSTRENIRLIARTPLFSIMENSKKNRCSNVRVYICFQLCLIDTHRVFVELRCSDTIPNGYIGPACSREYGSYCYNYQCNPDYNKTPASPSLKCNASGLWYWSKGLTKALCTRTYKLFTANNALLKFMRFSDICSYCSV